LPPVESARVKNPLTDEPASILIPHTKRPKAVTWNGVVDKIGRKGLNDVSVVSDYLDVLNNPKTQDKSDVRKQAIDGLNHVLQKSPTEIRVAALDTVAAEIAKGEGSCLTAKERQGLGTAFGRAQQSDDPDVSSHGLNGVVTIYSHLHPSKQKHDVLKRLKEETASTDMNRAQQAVRQMLRNEETRMEALKMLGEGKDEVYDRQKALILAGFEQNATASVVRTVDDFVKAEVLPDLEQDVLSKVHKRKYGDETLYVATKLLCSQPEKYEATVQEFINLARFGQVSGRHKHLKNPLEQHGIGTLCPWKEGMYDHLLGPVFHGIREAHDAEKKADGTPLAQRFRYSPVCPPQDAVYSSTGELLDPIKADDHGVIKPEERAVKEGIRCILDFKEGLQRRLSPRQIGGVVDAVCERLVADSPKGQGEWNKEYYSGDMIGLVGQIETRHVPGSDEKIMAAAAKATQNIADNLREGTMAQAVDRHIHQDDISPAAWFVYGLAEASYTLTYDKGFTDAVDRVAKQLRERAETRALEHGWYRGKPDAAERMQADHQKWADKQGGLITKHVPKDPLTKELERLNVTELENWVAGKRRMAQI